MRRLDCVIGHDELFVRKIVDLDADIAVTVEAKLEVVFDQVAWLRIFSDDFVQPDSILANVHQTLQVLTWLFD